MSVLKIVGFWGVFALVGCSAEATDPDAGSEPCPINDQPAFELGTGAERFEALQDDQLLRMAPGLQGGCHFWLSVRTEGFAERLFNIEYELFYADSSTTTGSTSGQRVRLKAIADQPGRCEYVGYTAFILNPPALVGKRIRIDVDVTDDLGRKASASRTVRAEYPEGAPELCMRR